MYGDAICSLAESRSVSLLRRYLRKKKKKKERKSCRAEMLIVNGIDNDDLT